MLCRDETTATGYCWDEAMTYQGREEGIEDSLKRLGAVRQGLGDESAESVVMISFGDSGSYMAEKINFPGLVPHSARALM